MDNPSVKFQLIHDIVSDEQNILSLSDMCDIARVSRSGYYHWVNSADIRNQREATDKADFDLILEAYKFRGYQKGARCIQMRLLHKSPPIQMNLKKIRRLMKKFHLFCPIRKANPYRRMAKALRTNNVADNILNREFTKHGPRFVLLTDITYIPFDGDFFYLSTIIDSYTKQVLSYVLSESLELDFVLQTVNLLIESHHVSLQTETLIHSDQGCHYTSYRFIQLVKYTP